MQGDGVEPAGVLKVVLTPGAVASDHGPLPPLFRWPGGKRRLVPAILGALPRSYGGYFEPFFGAGALFFALRPKNATISDSNTELMDCYRSLRDEPDAVAERLQAMPRDQEAYYRIRAQRPDTSAQRAARFIYLAQLAFNGIYRVNKRGEFNVPFGGRTYDQFGASETLRTYGRALQGTKILNGDFGAALRSASGGDLAYLDPPYTVAHSNNGFLKYNDKIFSWRDQRRLALTARRLARGGTWLLVSNAAHASTRALYPGFTVLEVERPSLISANPKGRGTRAEYIFTNVARSEAIEPEP